MKDFFLNVWKYGQWVLMIFFVLFIALVLYRIPFVAEEDRSNEAVLFINSQTISMSDVTGENLPSMPDKELNDSTIEGIDVNNNGIRDDVELAIFEKYPDDIKVRAAVLQYAMGLQMELTKVFSTDTWKAATEWSGRGLGCILESLKEGDFTLALDAVDEVNALIVDTNKRDKEYNELNRFAVSSVVLKGEDCDVLIQ